MPATRAAFVLALYAHACFFLGIAGWLRPVPILLATITCAAGLRFSRPRVAWIGFLPLVPLALYPAIAFDETLYHLPFVQAFARDGAVRFLIDHRFPVFSVLHEVLCVPPFLLGGDVATHFVALVELVILLALLIEWDARAGWLAAALFLGSPLVVELATNLHVELGLTLFIVAGFLALERERYGLAGFFLGSACSVKYLGFYFAAAASALVLARRGRVAAFAIACALTALPMTVWITVHTGDPLFPFLRPSLWSLAHPFPPPTWIERATLIWNVTFARDRVGFQPPVTPFLALLLIALIVGAFRRNALARWVLMLSAVYVVVFNFLPQDSRYLVPVLALVSMASATVIAARWPKAVPLLAILAVSPGIAYAGYRLVRQGVPPLTASARTEWLEQRIPEYRALQRAGTDRVYACRGEQLKAHARGPFLGDHAGPWSYARVLGDAGTTGKLAERMRSIDARYYLVAKTLCPPPRANGGMVLVYEDPAAQLWRVEEELPRPDV